jgi:Schlafen, AlbA_2
MDFIEWCDTVLGHIVEMTRVPAGGRARDRVMNDELSTAIFGEEKVSNAGYWHSPYRKSVIEAMQALIGEGLLEEVDRGNYIRAKMTPKGRDYLIDKTPFWESICGIRLDADEERVLRVVNRLSQHTAEDQAWLELVNHDKLLPELGWTDVRGELWSISERLKDRRLVWWQGVSGPHINLKSTYRSLVWETRRGFTLESKLIDSLVAEWETTSVDFKRELYLDTADQKAEFVKDVIGLANTQASGQRWMIIGFDDSTRAYHGPPDPKVTQNRMEQILTQYATPNLDIRYEIVDYRAGQVGKLEVRRDPKKLPFSVADSIGDRKRITAGQMFVRHGSQTEAPTPVELSAIQEEGDRARVT